MLVAVSVAGAPFTMTETRGSPLRDKTAPVIVTELCDVYIARWLIVTGSHAASTATATATMPSPTTRRCHLDSIRISFSGLCAPVASSPRRAHERTRPSNA